MHLAVVVQQSQNCCTVLIAINAHHGFSGSAQRVLQVVLPRLIISVQHSAGGNGHLARHHHYQSFTDRATRQWEETQ